MSESNIPENNDLNEIKDVNGKKASDNMDGMDKENMEGIDDKADNAGKTDPDKNTGRQSLKSEVLDWLLHIAIAVAAGLLIVVFIAQVTIVHDISMEPTLTEGDRLLVEKVSYRFDWLKRGDIIIFKSPEDDRLLIKRLIALEGDKVEVRDGKVYVNGEISLIGLPEEPETPDGLLPEYTNMTVPEGMAYVLGDNRPYSLDSTEFGPVEKKWIKGRAILRLYPFSRFRLFG